MIYISNGYLAAKVPNTLRFELLPNNPFTGGGAASGMPTDDQIDAAFATDGIARMKATRAILAGQIIQIDIEPSPRHAVEIIDAEVQRYIDVHAKVIEHIRAIAYDLGREATIALYGVPLTDRRGRAGTAISKDFDHPFKYWWSAITRKAELAGKRARRNDIYGRMKRSRDDDGRLNAIGIIDKVEILAPVCWADITMFQHPDDPRRQFRAEYWLPELIRDAMNSAKRVAPMVCAHGWYGGETPAVPADEMHVICKLLKAAGIKDIFLFEDSDIDIRDRPDLHDNLEIINSYFGRAA